MKSIANTLSFAYDSLEEAFPETDPGFVPFGSRVLLQIRTPKKQTASGLYIPDDVRETEHYNTQIAKVISVGVLAFHNRTTGEPWPEDELPDGLPPACVAHWTGREPHTKDCDRCGFRWGAAP